VGRPKIVVDETMLNAAKRLKEVRESAGMNQKEFAEKFGVKPYNYCRYESGDIARMPLSFMEVLRDEYKLSFDWLSGIQDAQKYIILDKYLEGSKKVPVLGNIAAGTPITAQQTLIGYEIIPVSEKVDFCLIVHGDSMIGARIFDGDLVYIKVQPEVESGEIAAIMIGDEDAVLKRFYRAGNAIILKSENPQYQDMIYTKNDFKNIKIIGKAVAVKFNLG
jgi:repressor LexA